ncbi:MAG TPA: GFA family protein [Albitalea sp.]|nr:GFA family protein [Albitalea sp.]
MADTTPSTELPPLTGGCLCGQVRYEARPDHREGYYCHCRMCQLAFGNTRAAFFNLRKSEVRWLTPPAYYVSSKIARRGFCSHCGTPLSFEFNDSPNMDLSVGSLDDPSVLTPVSHYAIESRIAGWHAEDGLPGHRLDENEQISKRWKDAYGEQVMPGLAATRGR